MERGDGISADEADPFLREFERSLTEHNTEYESKRQSNRLGPVRLALLPPGSRVRDLSTR